MLTEEQIKNLKPGDIVDVRGFVNLPLCNGNILVEFRHEFDHRILPAYKQISTEFISLPGEPEEKPKYDPCRKFKKGDLVKKRYIFGRSCDAIGSLGIYTVVEDEDTNGGNVVVQDSVNMRYKVKAVFLQLVVAVEDKPVYSVQKIEDQDRFDIMRDDLCVMSFPFGPKEHGYYYNETAAKEDAEIECVRLNNLYKQKLENNG